MLHPYLVQASQLARSIQVTPIEIFVPPSIMQSEVLHGVHALQVNLGKQGANEILNKIFNIVRQQNSFMLEERLQRLEQSLHNTSSVNILSKRLR